MKNDNHYLNIVRSMRREWKEREEAANRELSAQKAKLKATFPVEEKDEE